jgi:hypothetical protein
MKEVEKLAVGKDGVLTTTGKSEINLDQLDELQEVNYTPVKGEIVMQPLTMKEVKTASGILLPENKKELRAAIVKVGPESNWKRGQVVRLDGHMFGGTGVPVDYICGKPVLQLPEHFIRGSYDGLDLSTWKSE